MNTSDEYRRAQAAMAELKAAVHSVLSKVGDRGLTNAQVGRMLGIYHGHVGHEGHIPRVLLGLMQAEGVIEQDPEKLWKLRSDE